MTNTGLTPVDETLWVLNRFTVLSGCRASLRMTVMKTDKGLLLYSPVEMNADQRAAIDALGTVHAIVAPNLYHHLFLRAAIEAWPEARVLVPDGMAEKIGPVPRAEVMRSGVDLGIPEGLETFVFSGHAIRETLFWQAATKTLVTSDLIYNYRKEHFPVEKLFFRFVGAYGAPKLPFYHRFALRDRASLSALLDWVERREIRRLVMSHGRIHEGDDAGALFVKAWVRV